MWMSTATSHPLEFPIDVLTDPLVRDVDEACRVLTVVLDELPAQFEYVQEGGPSPFWREDTRPF